MVNGIALVIFNFGVALVLEPSMRALWMLFTGVGFIGGVLSIINAHYLTPPKEK